MSSIQAITEGASQKRRKVEPPHWNDDPVSIIACAALVILGAVLIAGATKQLMESQIGKGAMGLLVICVAIQWLKGMNEDVASIVPLEEANQAEHIRWALDQWQEHIEEATIFGDGSFSVKFKVEEGRERKKLNLQGQIIRISPELKGEIDSEKGTITFTQGWMAADFCQGVFTSIHGISLVGNAVVFDNTFMWFPYSWPCELSQNENTPHNLCEGCRSAFKDYVMV